MKKSLFVAAIAVISLVACKKGEATTGADSLNAKADSATEQIDSTAKVATDSINKVADSATKAIDSTAKKVEEKAAH